MKVALVLTVCLMAHAGPSPKGTQKEHGPSNPSSAFGVSDSSGAVGDLPPDVREYLAQLSGMAERHEWGAFLELADPVHRHTQVDDMGQPVEFYIQELIGLHRVGNELEHPVATPSGFPYLDRIRSFQFERWQLQGEILEVTGTITLDDGQRRSLRVMLVWIDGSLYLTGAVG